MVVSKWHGTTSVFFFGLLDHLISNTSWFLHVSFVQFFFIRIQPNSRRSWGSGTHTLWVHTYQFFKPICIIVRICHSTVSPQWPRRLFLADSPYIHSCLNLSTTATFFCPLGGCCEEVQLYSNFLHVSRSQFTLFLSCLMVYCYLGEGVSRPWEPGEEHPSWCPRILN